MSAYPGVLPLGFFSGLHSPDPTCSLKRGDSVAIFSTAFAVPAEVRVSPPADPSDGVSQSGALHASVTSTDRRIEPPGIHRPAEDKVALAQGRQKLRGKARKRFLFVKDE